MLTPQRKSRLQLTINQGHPGPVSSTRANSREIAIQEFWASYLQAFLDDFGGKLIHTVIYCPMEDMLGGATLVMGSTVLADVLDTPVAKLTVSEYIDLRYNFFDCWSLLPSVLCP